MAKLDIDFILLDESTVRYGFRALMSGGVLEGFKNNPVMLLQHNRPKEDAGADDIMLPIGAWYDIRIDGNKLLAKPDFDDDDELAQRVQKKVEKGYLNGVSVWIDPLLVSDDSSVMLAGQTLPTFLQWEILEASIVDIPNCKNALAIRNSAGNKIALSADTNNEIADYLKTLSTTSTTNKMDKKLLSVKLGLAEDATDDQIGSKLSAILLAVAANVTLSEENKNLKDRIVAMETAKSKEKIETLLSAAVTDGKFTEAERAHYEKLAAADFDTTKLVIDAIKPYESVENKLTAGGGKDSANAIEITELVKLSGNELYLQGKLERLRDIAPEQFKLKYKEAFGTEFPVTQG